MEYRIWSEFVRSNEPIKLPEHPFLTWRSPDLQNKHINSIFKCVPNLSAHPKGRPLYSSETKYSYVDDVSESTAITPVDISVFFSHYWELMYQPASVWWKHHSQYYKVVC